MDHGISDGGPLIIYCERKEDESLGDRPAKQSLTRSVMIFSEGELVLEHLFCDDRS